MYSSYIYGEKRANCPVTEIYQYGSPELYKRHWRSLQLILQQAKEIWITLKNTFIMDKQELLNTIAAFSDFEAKYYLSIWKATRPADRSTSNSSKIAPNKLFTNKNGKCLNIF